MPFNAGDTMPLAAAASLFVVEFAARSCASERHGPVSKVSGTRRLAALLIARFGAAAEDIASRIALRFFERGNGVLAERWQEISARTARALHRKCVRCVSHAARQASGRWCDAQCLKVSETNAETMQ